MTREEFLQGLSVLVTIYSKDMTQEQISAWYPFFEHDSFDSFRRAIKEIVVTNKFFPSVADIKAAMAENNTNELTADQAWSDVQRAITRYGYYRADEAMASLPDLTKSAVAQLGGFQAVCSSESGEWLRKDFVKIYDDMRSRHIIKYVTGNLISIADIQAHRKAIEEKEDEYDIAF